MWLLLKFYCILPRPVVKSPARIKLVPEIRAPWCHVHEGAEDPRVRVRVRVRVRIGVRIGVGVRVTSPSLSPSPHPHPTPYRHG